MNCPLTRRPPTQRTTGCRCVVDEHHSLDLHPRGQRHGSRATVSTLRSSRQRPRELAVYQATPCDVFWEVQAPSRNHKARSAHEWGTEGRGRAPDPPLLARASKSVNRAQEDQVFTFWGTKGGPEQPRTNQARDTVDTDTELPAGPAAGEIRGSLRGPPVGSASRGADPGDGGSRDKGAQRCLRLPSSGLDDNLQS